MNNCAVMPGLNLFSSAERCRMLFVYLKMFSHSIYVVERLAPGDECHLLGNGAELLGRRKLTKRAEFDPSLSHNFVSDESYLRADLEHLLSIDIGALRSSENVLKEAPTTVSWFRFQNLSDGIRLSTIGQ